MNERIKELAEQAASFAETAYNKQTMATFHTNKSAEEIFREKFAELIVRECICQCDDENSQKYIMAHFGMKESDWS